MALQDSPTRATLRAQVLRELLDSSARWWSSAEVNRYLDDWMYEIQGRYELVWGTATVTNTGTATLTLTDIATDILRLDAVYWNDRRLVYMTKDQLEFHDREWRAASTSTTPRVIYQDGFGSVSLWPPPSDAIAREMVFEYPRELTFVADTSTLELPAWTKYTALDYVPSRAYGREGPMFNGPRADRYRGQFSEDLLWIGKTWRAYMPKRSFTLRPGGRYEVEHIEPIQFIGAGTATSGVTAVNFEDETPSGAINGANVTFTLSFSPNPADSLELMLDGVELVQGISYTLSGSTITMTNAPVTGQTLFAHYRHAG